MLYVSGRHALNIQNSLNTCGDWHTSAMNWKKLRMLDSEDSMYGEWGIETGKTVPDNEGVFNVANDIRAVLDFMEQDRSIGLKGFYNDYFCTDEYDEVFFEKVYVLREKNHWFDIDNLMVNEFLWKWDVFLIKKGESYGRLENETQGYNGSLS